MIRRIFSIVVAAAMISSCGNSGKKEVSSKTGDPGTATKVEFSALVANPDSFVGKNIAVEGKVVHVCTQSGKKLFIVGENPDIRLFVSAGENMPKFPMELLGSQIVVEGTITKVGGPAMAMTESQPKSMEVTSSPASASASKGDSCETETALAAQASLADIIMEYKSHTVK